MQIQVVPISSLKPHPKNPRKHSEEQLAKLERSISEYGFTNPVIAKLDGTILAGHGRVLAAERLGLTEAPVIYLVVDDAKADAYVIADNYLGELSEWDDALLRDVLAELEASQIDTTITGLTEEEIAGLISEAAHIGKVEIAWDEIETPQPEAQEDDFDVDAALEETEEPVTRRGDIWHLGRHRLMCGDSTIKNDISLLMDGTKADMVFTDPPYGVAIGDKNKFLNSVQKAGRCLENLENDTLSPEELYKVLLDAFKNTKSVIKDCAAVYVTAPQGGGLGMMMMMMRDAGLEVRHVLNWIKNSPTFSVGRLDYDYQHEPILFTWNKTHKRLKRGTHQTSCWFIDKPRESKLHPTMKPIALVENAALNSSEINDIILDPFGGAGSTLIACEQLNRSCYMMEIDPKYCDVIVKRWEQFTGQKAERITVQEEV